MDPKTNAVLTLRSYKSPLRGFTWSRVRECLKRFDALVDDKQAFMYNGEVFMSLPWSHATIILGPKRIGIMRNWPKRSFIALPPKDIQFMVEKIINKYTNDEYNTIY